MFAEGRLRFLAWGTGEQERCVGPSGWARSLLYSLYFCAADHLARCFLCCTGEVHTDFRSLFDVVPPSFAAPVSRGERALPCFELSAKSLGRGGCVCWGWRVLEGGGL